MKFLVKASKGRIDEMVIDLEKEKQKAIKIQNSGRWKFASKLIERTRLGFISFGIDYERTAPGELTIYSRAVAGGFLNQDAVAKEVMKRAKQYGSDVSITVG